MKYPGIFATTSEAQGLFISIENDMESGEVCRKAADWPAFAPSGRTGMCEADFRHAVPLESVSNASFAFQCLGSDFPKC